MPMPESIRRASVQRAANALCRIRSLKDRAYFRKVFLRCFRVMDEAGTPEARRDAGWLWRCDRFGMPHSLRFASGLPTPLVA